MAGGRRSVTKADPCPICGRGSWCRWWHDSNDQGVRLYCCFNYPVSNITIPAGWKAIGPITKSGGQTFIPEGFNPERRITPEKRLEREKTEEQLRAKSIASARRLWQMAQASGGVNHARIIEYMHARGVGVDRLPGGKMPPTLRYIAECFRLTPSEVKGAEAKKEKIPAIVCAVKGPDNQVRAVQRIYLNRAGLPKKVEDGEAKKAMGSLGGGAVRLNAPCRSTGILVLCEGVETGLALLAALGDRATVWCCVSTAGLMGLELPPDDVDPRTGWIKRIIVAADADRAKKGAECGPGEHAAKICINQLLKKHEHLGGKIALPSREVAPALFDADGLPAGGGKSVDWLDVYDADGGGGADAVRRAVLGDWENATAVSAVREWPVRVVDQAEILLQDMFEPASKPGACWCIAYWNDEWWVCPAGGKEQWRRMPAELLESRVKEVMDGFCRYRGRKLGPLAPTKRLAAEVLHTASTYVGCTAESMPCWLPEQFDSKGEPTWKHGFGFGAWKQDGPIRPENVIATQDGLIDVEAWVRGELVIMPPTPRWFSANTSPVSLPVDLIRAAMKAEAAGGGDQQALTALVGKLCPTWLKFLEETFESQNDNGQSVEAVQRWFGYCLTPDVRLQKLLWLQGPPGTGKGTTCDVLTTMLGEDAVVNTTIDDMAGKFDTASMVGRRVCFIPEARVGKGDSSLALNRLLSISANDRVGVEGKYMQKVASVRLNIKFVITPNEEPRLHDNSVALLRRLIVVPTTAKKPDRPDPDLPEKLKAEIVGVFLWSLLGLKAIRMDLADGKEGIPQPGRGVSLLRDIERESSPVRAYVQDCCVVGDKYSVRSDLLRGEFDLWAAGNGHKPMAASSFGKALKGAVPGHGRKYQGTGRDREYAYEGLRPLLAGENPSKVDLPCNVDLTLEAEQKALQSNVRSVPVHEGRGDPFLTTA